MARHHAAAGWRTSTPSRELAEPDEGWSWSAIFTPDNRSLVTSGNDGLIRFWNLDTLQVALTLEHSLGPAVFINFSQDGKLMASEDGNGLIKLWSAASFPETTRNGTARR